MIYYLVYNSKAAPLLTEQTLKNILAVSRENNTKAGITGILLYHNNHFIQVLEGEKEKVLSIYQKIALDGRHSLVLKKIEGYEPERTFAEWSMGFKSVSAKEYEEAEGYLDLPTDGLSQETAANSGSPVLILLRKFLS
ncbi:MAG: BLUF domain-containing protein [Sphingobacteriales bacterium]|nr:MAG: BLUF domain-containing protein [Sphingobacteriales bacterium]